MDPPSSIPVRSSGIPRPTSRLPLRAPSSHSQLRTPSSTEQLTKKPSLPSLSRPKPTLLSSSSSLQKKPSRTSLAGSTLSAASTSTSTKSTISARTSLASAGKRPVPNTNPSFKKPIARPSSRQTRIASHPGTVTKHSFQEEDELGELNTFRSASSSRAGFRESEQLYTLEDDTPHSEEVVTPAPRRARPSLADRTIESLSRVQSSPAGPKTRRQSTFFNGDNSMPPPARPTSASGRPTTSDGTPVTPLKNGVYLSQSGAMTVPGKRSVSATTPGKTPSTVRPASQIRKFPLAQMQNIQSTSKPRPLSLNKPLASLKPDEHNVAASDTYENAGLRTRKSLAPTLGSPPPTASPSPSPNKGNTGGNGSPSGVRKVSNSSTSFRDRIAKTKVARATEPQKATESPGKASSSSSALREQIAKAKEAARRANAAKKFGSATPPREVPAVTENEFGIVPDPAEIAGFDFGLDDPFNQRPKGGKSLLRKRVDAARLDGRLNIAAMGLSEIPDEVLNMYKYDPSDSSVAWGELVDLTTIIAADNELGELPERMFPDVDIETIMESDDVEAPFGGVQSLDLHGNILPILPVGLRRLIQLSKLNLSRNQLSMEALDTVCQITTLRELKLADNTLEGSLPQSLGSLYKLEVLELQGNKISTLPEEIQDLAHLRTLNISNNAFKELPSGLFTSVPIVELVASKNSFSGSFFDIDTVPHLQHLQLANNSLTSLCRTGTVLLPALKSLNVTANRMDSLPDISSWTSLTTLMVAENKLKSLPDGFTSLHQLRTADFTANDLTKLDENIALMEALENLTVAANPLRERKFLTMNTEDLKRDLRTRLEPDVADTAQPDELGDTLDSKTGWELKPSGTLDLSFQNITEVDEEAIVEFSESNDVRQIYLQQNYLTTIPIVLSCLGHLSVLDLSKNNIAEPLKENLVLPKLKELRLAGNKLQSLEAITEFFSAPNLQQLNVSNNRISGALPSLRAVYPELMLLNASDNSISDVSAEALQDLKIVNLSNNEIPRLDPQIGLLSGTLTGFEVEGNTFRVPNYAVLRKGTDAVLSWLRDKIPSGADTFDVAPGSP